MGRPTSTTEPDRDGGFLVHTPLVLTTAVWPSHADTEDPSTPILGWVMENELNGCSMGFRYLDDEPTAEDVERFQWKVFAAIRDAAIPDPARLDP